MDCCDGDYDDGEPVYDSHQSTIKAKKSFACTECKVRIKKGEEHEYTWYQQEHRSKKVYARTCLVCLEIRLSLSCGNTEPGGLFHEIYENRGSECFAGKILKLSDEARSKLGQQVEKEEVALKKEEEKRPLKTPKAIGSITVRCPVCIANIEFKLDGREASCESFSHCSKREILVLLLADKVKLCPECGVGVKLKVSNVVMSEGVRA